LSENNLDFTVRLNYRKAQAAASVLYSQLNRFNRTFSSVLSIRLIDNVSKKLRNIFSMLGGEGGFTRLFSFNDAKVKNVLKKLRDNVSSIFNTGESKKWFEKIYGYFGKLNKIATRFGDILVGAFSAGGAGLVAAFSIASAVLSKKLISINSEMEQFEISLQTTLGSLTAAKQEMAGIVEFARETPYEIKQVTDAVVKLRAYSMDSDKWLEPLGNAASAFGRDITDAVEMAADAVQGMFRRALSYGLKMDKEEFKQGGKYAGMTYADALMMELKKRFEGGMELQAKTLKGIWSNIKDSLYIQFQEATKPIYGIIKKQVEDLYNYLGSDKGQTALRNIFNAMSKVIDRILSASKALFTFIKSNLVPMAKTVGEAMLKTFDTVSGMFIPMLQSLQPLIAAFTSVLVILSKVVTANETLLKLFVGYTLAIKVMRLLGFSVGKMATQMVAANKAATMLGATVNYLSKGIAIAGAAFISMWAVGNYIEVKNNLKEIGSHIKGIASTSKQVKEYLLEIGEETGHTLKGMTKLALAAKEFGANMKNVVEVSARASSKAAEGLSKNLGDFDIDESSITTTIGKLASIFIEETDTLEEMREKTEAAGNALTYLQRIADKTGVHFNELSVAIENNETLLSRYSDKVEELLFLIEQFGIATKELGKDVGITKFLETLEMLYTPTKKMLIELPIDTWIAKPMDEILKEDLEKLGTVLSESLDEYNLKNNILSAAKYVSRITDDFDESVLDTVDNTAYILVDAAKDTKNYLLEGAEAIEKSAIILSNSNKNTPSGGAGISQSEGLNVWGKFANLIQSSWEAATAVVVASLAGLAFYMRNIDRGLDKVNKVITGVALSSSDKMGSGYSATLEDRLININSRLFAKSLPKNIINRVEVVRDAKVDTLTKELTKELKDIQKELKDVRRAFNEGIISQLSKEGWGRGSLAIPEGMSADDFIKLFPEEALKTMTDKQMKIFDTWRVLFEGKILELEEKLINTREKAAKQVIELTKTYNDLIDTLKTGKLPESFRSMIDEVLELTKNMRISKDSVSKFNKIFKKTNESIYEAPKKSVPEVSKFRKGIMGLFLNAFDFIGFKMVEAVFKKGFNLKAVRESLLGVSRIIGDWLAAISGNIQKATGRIYSLTIGPYSAKLLGKGRSMFTGKLGLTPETMIPGYLTPGEGEQYRPLFQKIINSLSGKTKGVTTAVDQLSVLTKETDYEKIRQATAEARSTEKLVGAIRQGKFIPEPGETDFFVKKLMEFYNKLPKDIASSIKYAMVKTSVGEGFGGYVGKGEFGGLQVVFNKAVHSLTRLERTVTHEVSHLVGIGDDILDMLDQGLVEEAKNEQWRRMQDKSWNNFFKRNGMVTTKSLDYIDYIAKNIGINRNLYTKKIDSFIKTNAKTFAELVKTGVYVREATQLLMYEPSTKTSGQTSILRELWPNANMFKKFMSIGNDARGTSTLARVEEVLTDLLVKEAQARGYLTEEVRASGQKVAKLTAEIAANTEGVARINKSIVKAIEPLNYVAKRDITSKLVPSLSTPSTEPFSRTARKILSIEKGVVKINKNMPSEFKDMAEALKLGLEEIPIEFRKAIELINVYATTRSDYYGKAFSKGSIGFIVSAINDSIIGTAYHEMVHILDMSDAVINAIDQLSKNLAKALAKAHMSYYAEKGPQFTEELSLKYLEWFADRIGVSFKEYTKVLAEPLYNLYSEFVELKKTGANIDSGLQKFIEKITKVVGVPTELTKGRFAYLSNQAGTELHAGANSWETRMLDTNERLIKAFSRIETFLEEKGVKIDSLKTVETILDKIVEGVDKAGDAAIKIEENLANIRTDWQKIFKETGAYTPGKELEKIDLSTTKGLFEYINNLTRAFKNMEISSSQYFTWMVSATQKMKKLNQTTIEVVDEAGKTLKKLASSTVLEIEAAKFRDAKGRFLSGNPYQFTPGDLGNHWVWSPDSSTAIQKYIKPGFPAIKETPGELLKVNIVKDSVGIEKRLNKMQTAFVFAMGVDLVDNLGNQYLEPYFEELIAQGKASGAVGMAAWKLFPTEWPVVGEVLREVVTIGLEMSALVPVIMPVIAAFSGLTEAVRHASGILGTLAGGGELRPGIDIADTTGMGGIEKFAEHVKFQIGKILYDSFTGLGSAVKGALIKGGNYLEDAMSHVGAWFTGNFGKIPQVDYSLTESIWGKEGVEQEKAIEQRYRDTKDLAEREANYRVLMEEKVAIVTEVTSQKRLAVYKELNKRITENYEILEREGKATTEDLVKEVERARQYVKENIHFGTEWDEETFTGLIQGFEKESVLAADAFMASFEKELRNYDLSSPEGFTEFISSLDDSQIALTLGITALRQLEDEFNTNAKALTILNKKLLELEAEMAPIEYRIKEIDRDLISLNQSLTNVMASFDLAIAINELELVGEEAQTLKYEIAKLNLDLAKSENNMAPLVSALSKVEKEFEKIQEAVDETQRKLNEFMNAPIEGETDFLKEKYRLEDLISAKEREIEKAEQPLAAFEKYGFTDSDAYKQLSVPIDKLNSDLADLQTEYDDLIYSREEFLKPLNRKIELTELSLKGEEKSRDFVMDQIDSLAAQLKEETKILNEKQSQLDIAEQLVAREEEKNEKIKEAIDQRNRELELIEKQVAFNNILLQNAKDKLDAEKEAKDIAASIIPIDSKRLTIQGMISAEKLLQNAQDFAAGLISKEAFMDMANMHNEVTSEIASLTKEKIGGQNELGFYQFDMDKITDRVNFLNEEQTSLSSRINTLVETIQQLIGGVNLGALSKTDLTEMFGENVGQVIRRMGVNLEAIARGDKSMAISAIPNAGVASLQQLVDVLKLVSSGAYNVPGMQYGGIETRKEGLALLHGPEAVVPLQSGAIPVKLLGANSANQEVTISNTFGNMTFIVRDDDDIEEIKSAIVDLRQGNTGFFSKPYQYSERF